MEERTEADQMLDAEKRWILARDEYKEECKIFQRIYRAIPKKKQNQSPAQIIALEYAKMKFSNAAKKLREEEHLYKSQILPPELAGIAEDLKIREFLKNKASMGASGDTAFEKSEFTKAVRRGARGGIIEADKMSMEELKEKLKEQLDKVQLPPEVEHE